jgi:hypothetical protein
MSKVLHKLNRKDKPFVTEKGVAIFIEEVSPILFANAMIAKRAEEPQPPTYEVESLGGVTTSLPHTHETLETEEDKRAYQAYLMAHSDWEMSLMMTLMRVFIEEGVTGENNPDILAKAKQSVRKFAKYGIKIASDENGNPYEDDLLFEYIASFVLVTKNDINGFLDFAMKKSNVDLGRLQESEAMFRTDIQGEAN